jgi:hypothetical protein
MEENTSYSMEEVRAMKVAVLGWGGGSGGRF